MSCRCEYRLGDTEKPPRCIKCGEPMRIPSRAERRAMTPKQRMLWERIGGKDGGK